MIRNHLIHGLAEYTAGPRSRRGPHQSLSESSCYAYVDKRTEQRIILALSARGTTELRSMAAAVINSRGSFQNVGSSREFMDRNTISIPQLPDKKDWFASFDVEILMLDG